MVSEKMMATTVEALLGAIYLDGGHAALVRSMENLGLIHPALTSVTFKPPSHASKEQTTLVVTLIEFLDCDVGDLQVDRKGASKRRHDWALSASHVCCQSLTRHAGLSDLQAGMVRPV